MVTEAGLPEPVERIDQLRYHAGAQGASVPPHESQGSQWLGQTGLALETEMRKPDSCWLACLVAAPEVHVL